LREEIKYYQESITTTVFTHEDEMMELRHELDKLKRTVNKELPVR
jgi:hypothetical protein